MRRRRPSSARSARPPPESTVPIARKRSPGDGGYPWPMKDGRSVARQAGLLIVVLLRRAGPRGTDLQPGCDRPAVRGSQRIGRRDGRPDRGRRHRRLRHGRSGEDLRPAAARDRLLLHGRRQRLRKRQHPELQRLLCPNLGPRPRSDHRAGPRQPRLGHARRGRLPRVFRIDSDATGRDLVLDRSRGMARHRPGLGLRIRRWLRRRVAAGSVAPQGPRRQLGPLHSGDLAPPPVQLGRAR